MAAYPRPQLPHHSVLSLATFRARASGSFPSILDNGEGKLVTSGRMAIALALQHMGVGPGDKILIPAFHCTSMVDPVIWVGATPVFYRIQEDTQVNLDDIRSRLDPAVKALMITHYFGFPQDTVRARAFCDEAGIALIEDCAHAFFGDFAGKPPGWYGDYAIASAMKFFPVYDGGCLVSSRRDVSTVPTSSASLAFQLKAGINTLEDAFLYGRLPALKVLMMLPMWLKDIVWGVVKSVSPQRTGTDVAPAASSGGYEFDAAWLDKRMTRISRWIMKLASKDRIVERRRRHYLLLLEAMSGVSGAHPLFPKLPGGVVPYMFPLLVDDPARVFPALKQMGVPMLRWETFAPSVSANEAAFPVSHNLSRRLLQFPCHEEFTTAELQWMIGAIRNVLNSGAPAGLADRTKLEGTYEVEASSGR